MEKNSIEKNLSEIEIYLVITMAEDFAIIDTHVTLSRGSAILKAYDMYYDHKDTEDYCTVFVDTWKNGIMIKSEHIDDNEKLIVGYENYNV